MPRQPWHQGGPPIRNPQHRRSASRRKRGGKATYGGGRRKANTEGVGLASSPLSLERLPSPREVQNSGHPECQGGRFGIEWGLSDTPRTARGVFRARKRAFLAWKEEEKNNCAHFCTWNHTFRWATGGSHSAVLPPHTHANQTGPPRGVQKNKSSPVTSTFPLFLACFDIDFFPCFACFFF